MSEKVQLIEWPTFVEEGGGIRRATNAEVLREFNKTINENTDLRGQLAQREAEIEALRALLQDAVEAIEAEGLDTEYFERRWLYLYPESPALTDKEGR